MRIPVLAAIAASLLAGGLAIRIAQTPAREVKAAQATAPSYAK